MNFKRKLKRANLPKVPKHCGKRMIFKPSPYNAYVCSQCGFVKAIPTSDEETEETPEEVIE